MEIKSQATLDGKVVLVLSELEARALLGITTYGHKPFLDWFHRNLGKHYTEKYDKGIPSLFNTVKNEMPKHLKKFDESRKVFEKV